MKASWPLYFLLSVCLARPQDDTPDASNFFVSPPPAGPKVSTNGSVYLANPVYKENSERKLSWRTSVEAVSLILFQEGPGADGDTPYMLQLTQDNSDGEQDWNGTIGDIELDKGAVFFIAAYDSAESGSPIFYSHYFNITKDNSTTTNTTTSSTVTSTRLTSSTSTGGASTTAAPSTTSTGSSSESTSASPSSTGAAVVSYGIGNGLGSTILSVVAAVLFW